MTRFGKVMAIFMVIWLSFCALWLFGVLPKEKIKELTSPAIESLVQLASWLKRKVSFLLDIIIQKFFSSI
jgi:predicted MPP superfamily phosphohydrolase